MTKQAFRRPGRKVLVLGGGLAGIAAALRLAEAGWHVVLIEARRRLGGRAGSHIDPQSDELLDNCQHVLLGCCTHLIDLYRRLGVSHMIEWHEALHFLDGQGHHDILRRSRLPAPLHLGVSIARFRSLSWQAKRDLSRAALALARCTPPERRRWENEPFVHWLAVHGQPPEAIDRFWNPVITSALNQDVRQANAAYALQVLRQGFLAHRDAYLMGVATVPLGRLYEPAERILQERGGRVLLGTSVRRLVYERSRLAGVELRNQPVMEADAYVSALPVEQLLRAAPSGLREADERFDRLHELRSSPILGVHLWFDRAVMRLPHAALLDSPLHWVFNRGQDASGRQHLHVVISAAVEWMNREPKQILADVCGELMRYLPETRTTPLAAGKVVKERRATFAPVPGVDALRPPPTGSTGNLVLAGDFCQTGWPATMEGAVRSGYRAAAALMNSAEMSVADLPDAWLARNL